MRRATLLSFLLIAFGLYSCAETVRCPEGEVFDETGRCIAIPDAGAELDGG